MRTPTPVNSLTREWAAQKPLARPDPALSAAGIEGEYVVAQVRAIAMAMLLIAPTWNLITKPGDPIHLAGWTVTFLAAVASAAFWWYLRRGRWRPWIGFATSAFDVTMVTSALIAFLVVSSPTVALNSKVTFEMYFLAIIATSLRYDARICLAIGALALVEYGGLWAYASIRYDLADPRYVSDAGPYIPVDIWTRLILLVITTALSVTVVRRAQRLLYLAARDRLTGLYNRGHFDRALSTAIAQAARDGQPLSVAILDVDKFKQINDVHGHDVGDRVLQQVAGLLTNSMRRTDIVARYGGEEFVILMPSTNRENALVRMETLRREVAEAPIVLGGEETLNISFSAGVAGLPLDAAAVSGKDLVSVADRRLLAAKRAGRARCVGSDVFAASA